MDEINDGYSMMNENRFAIMDNQQKLDRLNTRVNTLLSNLNKLQNTTSNNKSNNSQATFY